MHVISFHDHVAHELERAGYGPQRRLLGLATLLLGGLACLAFLVSLAAGRGWGVTWLLVALALLAAAGLATYEWAYRKKADTRGQLRAGLAGQALVARTLAALDDRYYLLNNLQLPGWRDDADHVVVGPNGVFVLETKHHRGRLTWREGAWYQQKDSQGGHAQPERPVRDPVRQLERNVSYLRRCIHRTDPVLARRTRLWMEGVVVLTHPAVRLDLPPEATAALRFPVLRVADLPAHITAHLPRQPLSRADVSRIVSLFGHLRAPASPTPRSPSPSARGSRTP